MLYYTEVVLLLSSYLLPVNISINYILYRSHKYKSDSKPRLSYAMTVTECSYSGALTFVPISRGTDMLEAVSEWDGHGSSDECDAPGFDVDKSCFSSSFFDKVWQPTEMAPIFDEIVFKYGELGNDEELCSYFIWFRWRRGGGVQEW